MTKHKIKLNKINIYQSNLKNNNIAVQSFIKKQTNALKSMRLPKSNKSQPCIDMYMLYKIGHAHKFSFIKPSNISIVLMIRFILFYCILFLACKLGITM